MPTASALLVDAQKTVLTHLKEEQSDTKITAILKMFRLSGKAGHSYKELLPLVRISDSRELQYEPAVLMDHIGHIGFHRRYEIVQLIYTVKIGQLDNLSLIATPCLIGGSIKTVYQFLYHNGRYHNNTHDSSLVAPTDEKLLEWVTELFGKCGIEIPDAVSQS